MKKIELDREALESCVKRGLSYEKSEAKRRRKSKK